MPRSLRAGDRGPDVAAMQQGLHSALGRTALNRANGVYGSLTIADVKRFKKRFGVSPQDGRFFGSNAWLHLDRFLGRRQKQELEQAKRLEVERELEDAATKHRGLVVAEAHWGLAHNGLYVYRQYRPMADALDSVDARTRTDCSAFATLCYRAAGCPDPNGLHYNGYGYTGTLVQHGERTSAPRPGDLAFYGGTWQIPGHVAVIVEGGEVISFGHTPISRYPLYYRSDFQYCMTFAMV
jgi:hypothetical protein